MEKLITEIIDKIYEEKSTLDPTMAQELETIIKDKIYSVYPFNKFEYVISHLILLHISVLQSMITLI